MTPGAIRAFRAWFQFDRFLDPKNPEELFDALTKVAKWRYEQRSAPSRDLDNLVSDPIEDELARFSLLSHFATIDSVSFELMRRMMARQLTRYPDPSELTRHLAAALLDPGDIPSTNSPMLVRDIAMILALVVGHIAGWSPTQNREKVGKGIKSGIARLVESVPGVTLVSAENVWTNRKPRLVAAGFPEEVVSDFLKRASRTT